MDAKLHIVNTQNEEKSLKCDYTLTRLSKKQEFVETIVYKGSENIVKDYIYLEARKIIA